MKENSFDLTIITPDKIILSERVVSLVAPGEFGYLGILANHAPLVANLKEGKIVVRSDDSKATIFDSKGSGFLEVLKNKVNLILDRIA